MKKILSIMLVALSLVLGITSQAQVTHAEEKTFSFINQNEDLKTNDDFKLTLDYLEEVYTEVEVDERLTLSNESSETVTVDGHKLTVVKENQLSIDLKATQGGTYILTARNYNDFPLVEETSFEIEVSDHEVSIEENIEASLESEINDPLSIEEIEEDKIVLTNNLSRAGVTIQTWDIGYKHTGTALAPNGGSAWFDNQDISGIWANGEDAFCVEPWTIAGNGTNYSASAQERLRIDRIIYHGFVLEGKTDYARAVVSLMIWEEYGYSPTSHTVPNYANQKTLINSRIANHSERPSFHEKEYTIKLGESLTIEDTNNAYGVKELSKNDANVDYSWSGNKLTLTPKKYSSDDILEFYKYSKNVTGTSILYNSNDPSEQAVYSSKLGDPLRYRINIKVMKYGDIELSKTDAENGSFLADVKYGLYSDANATQLIKEVKTNSNGKILFKDLLVGTYYVKELETLDNYVYDDTITKVVVKPQETTKVELTNQRQKHKINIMKGHLQAREVLFGAEFQLYRNDTRLLLDENYDWSFDEVTGEPDFSFLTLVDTKTTDVNGLLDFDDLDSGQYIVYEFKAPLHYARNQKDIRIINAHSEDNFTLKYEYNEIFNNLPQLGSFLLHKTAKEDNSLNLEATTYKVFANHTRMFIESPEDLLLEDGTYNTDILTEIAEITTNEEGLARLDELHEGRYFYQESSQRLERAIDPKLYMFDIVFDNDYTEHVEVKVEHTNALRQYSFRLYKQDSKNPNLLLDGAKFSVINLKTKESLGTYVTGAFYYEGIANKSYALYTEDDVFIKDVVADDKGEIREYLEDGIYILKDTQSNEEVLSTQGVFKGSFMMFGMEHDIDYDVIEIEPPHGYEMPVNPSVIITPSEDFGVELIENYRVNDLIVVNVKTGLQDTFILYLILFIVAVVVLLLLQKKFLLMSPIGHTNNTHEFIHESGVYHKEIKNHKRNTKTTVNKKRNDHNKEHERGGNASC